MYTLDYVGSTILDRRFSSSMSRWIFADFRRRKCKCRVNLEAADGYFTAYSVDLGVQLFKHSLSQIIQYYHEENNMRTFMYLLKDDNFSPSDHQTLQCHVFTAFEFEDVVEIFQTMKEALQPQKSHSSAASLTSLCSDISPSNSQFFEVLYVGKLKVSHKHVPDTFVDDALEKIRQHELEKKRRLESEENADKLMKSRSLEMGRRVSDNGMIVCSTEQQQQQQQLQNQQNQPQSPTSDEASTGSGTTFRRSRAGSLGIIEATLKKKVEDANNNRTMLFYVGRDLRLISPDRKKVLLQTLLKDVEGCMRGLQSSEHFCFICRDSDPQLGGYVGFIFRCESDSIAEEVVSAIKQTFQYSKEHKTVNRPPVLSCEHCPMVWYHKLCKDLEGQNEKKCQMLILKRIESLPEDEQDIIHTKLLGAESSEITEQIEFLMILLRAHCEAKQAKHIHDTVENRSEFLNQYLGGSTIFMKAKRSLTSSFDQLLKRKGSQMDMLHSSANSSKESLYRRTSPIEENDSQSARRRSSTVGAIDVETMKRELKKAAVLLQSSDSNKSINDPNSDNPDGTCKKQSLSDIAAITFNNQKLEKSIKENSPEKDMLSVHNEQQNTPMINMFLKVGSSSPSQSESYRLGNQTTPSPSWRQTIYNRVVTPGKPLTSDNLLNRKLTKQDLRNLWKKAINQQVLLIRMERENARLRARQEEATVKRIKLEYDELSSASKESMGIWDLMSKDSRVSSSKCDSQMLLQAIRQGVPKGKRGDVWHFLASQYCMKQPPFDSSKFPNYDVPYEDLLKQLTSSQHAILIDLGRTFPNHPHFASPLGPGQLALFNLLKAYSLLDPQVGYCQGLSFVAGVLLLHMSEEQAFLLLRHLMFRRGMRKQYLPDMGSLPMQLYQLSRLLHDNYPKLYQHFDSNEITPALYATSWILTIFASQFPLGFVTRVFDLLFLEQTTDIIYRVILALFDEHRDALMSQLSFEDIMEYLKTSMPIIEAHMLEKIMKKALTMDISRQLMEYEVEYHVLQEERLSMKPEQEQLKRADLEIRRLTDQNVALTEQLDVVNATVNRLERTRGNQQSQINKLENQIRNLEITIATLGDFIVDIGEEHKDIDIPGDIRRLIANLELAEQRSTKKIRNDLNLMKKLDKSAILKRSQTSMGFYERPQINNDEYFSPDELPRGTRYGQSPSKVVPSFNEGERPIIKGVPLRVIIDEDDTRKSPPNPTNLFTNLFNNKNSKKPVADFSGQSNESFISVDDEKPQKFSCEIGQLPLKNINPKKLLKTQSELTIPFHPLSNDVNITFNGATKLKTLKPVTVRPVKNNLIDLQPLNSEILRVNEEESDFSDGKQLIDSKGFQTVTGKF